MTNFILLTILGIAVGMDMVSWHIDNRLIVLGLFGGIFFQIQENGGKGILFFLIDMTIPIILFYLLFQMHALGAGDIKLFSIVGSYLGIKGLCACIVCSFITGAVFSLIKMLYQQNLMIRLKYFQSYIKESISTQTIKKYDKNSDGKENGIHFSIAILIGFLVYLGVKQ